MEILSGNLTSVESSVWSTPFALGEGRRKKGTEMKEMEEQLKDHMIDKKYPLENLLIVLINRNWL
jgi:hypothetical protein